MHQGSAELRERSEHARRAAGGAVRRRRSCGGLRPPLLVGLQGRTRGPREKKERGTGRREASTPEGRRGEQFAEGEAAGGQGPPLLVVPHRRERRPQRSKRCGTTRAKRARP